MNSLSVVMLTYNHERYIDQAIDSVLFQKISDEIKKELIIVDDCSSDNTVHKILPKIRLFEDSGWSVTLKAHKNNLGVQETAREAFALATGRYLALLEGDDYWTSPDKLAKQYEVLSTQSDATICFTSTVYVDGEGSEIGVSPSFSNDRFTIKDLCLENIIHTPSVMYKLNKEYLDNKWLFKAPVVDWLMHLFHLQHGHAIYLNTGLSAYRIHQNGYWSGKDPRGRLQSWIDSVNICFNFLPIDHHPLLRKNIAKTQLTLFRFHLVKGDIIEAFSTLKMMYEGAGLRVAVSIIGLGLKRSLTRIIEKLKS